MPREPSRHEDCSGLIHPGTMTTQRLDFFGHELLTATRLAKGPKGHGILKRDFHF